MKEIEELENSIKYYANAYYSGNALIDDNTFDSLVDKLRKLKPDSDVLKTGWGFEVKKDKVKHKYAHIGSLEKTKTYEDIPSRFKNQLVFVSPKLDGLSTVVYYRNGKMTKALTRGNGEYGKDITDKVRLIIGNEIPDKEFTGGVRGEIIIPNSKWKKLQEKYTDLIAPRNFAAGIINRKEIDEDINCLNLVVYKIIGQENRPIKENRLEILLWLQNNFYNTIPIRQFENLTYDEWTDKHETIFEQFCKIGYGLDGLVLTQNNVTFNSETNGYMYDEVAFKFNAQTEETTVKDIEWTLSRTQRMIPVAVVEPIELSGAVVERATCNNAQMVKDMQIGVGARINIQRANEVIPFIVDVVEPTEENNLPEFCPICNSVLVWEGVDLKCSNKACPNITLSNLQQWCEQIGETDGLQWTLMKQFLDIYGIESIPRLYEKKDIVITDLTVRVLSITGEKAKDFFMKLYIKDVSIKKALLGLNIPRLGVKTAEQLGKHKQLIQDLLVVSIYGEYPTYRELKETTYKKCQEVVKEATTESIFNNFDKFANLRFLFGTFIDDTGRLVFLADENSPRKLRYIAVTGALETMKRKDFEEYIKHYGYELTSNLKKCEYLVCNQSSNSTKAKEAEKYNIPVISEQEFLSSLS